ncbi:hypothetical protein MPER_03977, partial [Moniliophthora perniciosa FA553]
MQALTSSQVNMAWGLEARVPFLDKHFLEVAMNVDPPVQDPYLPKSILWRQKEQFSDGVGYSWIDGMKDHAAAVVSDEQFDKRAERWPDSTPDTKEAYYIREIFEVQFPGKAAASTAIRWIPRGDWGCSADSS